MSLLRLRDRLVPRGGLVLALLLALGSAGASRAQTQPRANVYAVSVGVNIYAHPKVPDLKGCVNDGKTAAAQLRGQKGKQFGTVEVHEVLDRAATKYAVEQQFHWLDKAGKAGDTVVVFLSGHGVVNGRAWAFAPHDFDPAQQAQTTITDTMLINLADRLATQGKVVWIVVDACFSGQLRVNAQALLKRHNQVGKGGVVLMVSSMPRQLSQDLGNFSAFAHAVDEALKGAADFDKNGDITLKEVRRYVQGRLPELVPSGNQDGEIDYSLSLSDGAVLAKAILRLSVKDQLTNQDRVDPTRPGCYVKEYALKLEKGTAVVIDLMSGDGRPGPHNPRFFDTFLRVEDATGKVIAFNDDGGDGFNSRITLQSVNGGAYRLIVTSFPVGSTGEFVLQVRDR